MHIILLYIRTYILKYVHAYVHTQAATYTDSQMHAHKQTKYNATPIFGRKHLENK